MTLIKIKKARYLKRNRQSPQEKNRENLNRSNKYFGPITSCFSVERDFTIPYDTYLTIASPINNFPVKSAAMPLKIFEIKIGMRFSRPPFIEMPNP